MKTIALLLLLDYSGSMYQKVETKLKVDILKQDMRALLSSKNSDSDSIALVFGSEPEKNCKDIRFFQKKNTELAKTLMTISPGDNGKTPLSIGLKNLVQIAREKTVLQIVVLTDGADTCNLDPCKTLEEEDKKIKNSKTKINIKLIGFDLKQDEKKFSCFKKLNLKNILVDVLSVNNASDLQEILKSGKNSIEDSGFKVTDSDTNKISGLTRTKLNTKKNSSNKEKDLSANSDGISQTDAVLEVSGSPTTAEFRINNKVFSKNWFGSFPIVIKSGDYLISFISENGSSIEISLPPGTKTKIPWAKLMKISSTVVEFKSPNLSLELTPKKSTVESHGPISSLQLTATFESESKAFDQIPFGEWEAKITSPPWLVNKVNSFTFTSELSNGNKVSLQEVFNSQLIWVKNPHADKPIVLLLRNKEETERHLLLPGQEYIPILKSYEVEWLEP